MREREGHWKRLNDKCGEEVEQRDGVEKRLVTNGGRKTMNTEHKSRKVSERMGRQSETHGGEEI